jgi:hypothetical protein
LEKSPETSTFGNTPLPVSHPSSHTRGFSPEPEAERTITIDDDYRQADSDTNNPTASIYYMPLEGTKKNADSGEDRFPDVEADQQTAWGGGVEGATIAEAGEGLDRTKGANVP